MSLRRVQLIRDGVQKLCDPVVLRNFYDTLAEIHCSRDSKRSNYTQDALDLTGHALFDLAVDENKNIGTFCGVYNGGRYPAGVYRLLNRVYVTPHFRNRHGLHMALATKYLLPAQYEEICDRSDLVFVSREGALGRESLGRWLRVHWGHSAWRVHPRYVQVVPGVRNKRTFQAIAYQCIRKTDWFFEELDDAEWQMLPEGV